MLFVIGALLIMIEGFICVVLALPLFALLGGLSGLAMGAVCRRVLRPHRLLCGMAVAPFLGGVVEHALPASSEVQTIETGRRVRARPEDIWPHLLRAQDIRPEEIGDAWMYGIGVPLPLSAVSETAMEGSFATSAWAGGFTSTRFPRSGKRILGYVGGIALRQTRSRAAHSMIMCASADPTSICSTPSTHSSRSLVAPSCGHA